MNAQEKTALIAKLEQLLAERMTYEDAISTHEMYDVQVDDVDTDAVEVLEASFSIDYEAGGRRTRVDLDSVRVEVPDDAVTCSVVAKGDYCDHVLVDPDLLEEVLGILREPAASLSVRLRDLADEVEQMSQSRIETDRKLADYMEQVRIDGKTIAEMQDKVTADTLIFNEMKGQIDRLLREKAALCERVSELELRPEMPTLQTP